MSADLTGTDRATLRPAAPRHDRRRPLPGVAARPIRLENPFGSRPFASIEPSEARDGMDDRRNNPQKVAAEAVGERPANVTPAVAREQAEGVSGKVIRDRAFSAGTRSSVGTRTAE